LPATDLQTLFPAPTLLDHARMKLEQFGVVTLHSQRRGRTPIDGSVITVSHPNDLDASFQEAEMNAEGLGGHDVWIE